MVASIKANIKELTDIERDCPLLLECNISITKNFFFRICNTPQYQNCHHYARKKDQLKTPLIWLQKKAIQDEGKKGKFRFSKVITK